MRRLEMHIRITANSVRASYNIKQNYMATRKRTWCDI